MACVSVRKCCRRLCLFLSKLSSMNRFLRIFFIVCCAVSLFSCDDDVKDESDVAVFIEPGASAKVVMSSGDKYRYHLDFYTTHDRVQRLSVTSFDQYQGEIVVKDTSWNARTDSYDFIYTAPFIDRDSLQIRLTFNAWDNEGNKCEAVRTLLVLNKQVLMAEQSGIVLWNTETGRPDALMFQSPSKTYNLLATPDSADADMFIDTDREFENVRVKTNTGAKFVRNNSFDYAAATMVSLQSVYSGSRHDDMIDNLRVNDIVLVGHGDRAEGVFRVANIIRTGEADERCVQLSFKVLK